MSDLDIKGLDDNDLASLRAAVDVPPEVKELAVRARADFGLPMKVFVAQAIQRH